LRDKYGCGGRYYIEIANAPGDATRSTQAIEQASKAVKFVIDEM
jgi:hypothetical protein